MNQMTPRLIELTLISSFSFFLTKASLSLIVKMSYVSNPESHWKQSSIKGFKQSTIKENWIAARSEKFLH